jgi:serine protease Do
MAKRVEYEQMNLPTQIIFFFNIRNSAPVDGVIRPKSIMDFMATVSENDPTIIRNICQTFINEGLLVPTGSTNQAPITSETFYNFGADINMAFYGSYDFVAYGFPSIRTHFIDSVRPVIVKTSEGIDDIGTCFYIGDNIMLTARHCIEKMGNIFIPAKDGVPVKAKSIVFPKDDRIDIALIEFEDNAFQDVPAFELRPLEVLDEVLTMGYPPIPGFDAIQFAEISRISSEVKASRGNVVGQDKAYLDAQDYLLINAKVKGGNSGGPIINRHGFVGGMLVDIPADPDDKDKLDALGYGVAIPVLQLNALQESFKSNDFDNFKTIAFTNNERGFSTLSR